MTHLSRATITVRQTKASRGCRWTRLLFHSAVAYLSAILYSSLVGIFMGVHTKMIPALMPSQNSYIFFSTPNG